MCVCVCVCVRACVCVNINVNTHVFTGVHVYRDVSFSCASARVKNVTNSSRGCRCSTAAAPHHHDTCIACRHASVRACTYSVCGACVCLSTHAHPHVHPTIRSRRCRRPVCACSVRVRVRVRVNVLVRVHVHVRAPPLPPPAVLEGALSAARERSRDCAPSRVRERKGGGAAPRGRLPARAGPGARMWAGRRARTPRRACRRGKARSDSDHSQF